MSACDYVQPMVPQLVAALMEAIAQANSVRQEELVAAVKIQSAYRMWREFRTYRVVRKAVVCVQRMYRGHMQRKRVMKRREEAEESHERAVYEYYATRIQACFRGYYVRCHVDNFFARKLYIEETLRVSSEVREMATQLHHAQVERDAEARLTLQKQSYKEATEKLHHLVSTVSVSGVYRRPMVPCSTMSVYGSSVEGDIRHNSEAALRPQHIRKVRETLKTVLKERQNNGGVPAATGEGYSTWPNQGRVTDDAKGRDNVSSFRIFRGAWNRSRIDGRSLPPITSSSAGNGNKHLGNVVQHSCIDAFEPLYDTETAALLRCVDTKEIQALHGTKPFVVPAPRRVPL
ncbi:putative spermatogenesis-associated protein 17-like [Trypanosoma conorhini]|uniref:Putative spermatogenesis-associated protein 17-like n=1 Tax=Trypanosoma conorhini TaxID=83891 RepID=A0A3S5ISZ1_9TRYP|nr:putative spermatogenesis-associated protein 17-like [Trypanosoma conorhini]RNF14269.1 putative spermatogenesis-associated protein 17-like [Trypanosoma conorhini]